MRLMVFSFILFSACAGVPRPDTDLCVLNVPGKHQQCRNLLKDYDDNGNLDKTHKPIVKPLNSLSDVNKNTCTDPDGLARLKAYIQKLRLEAQTRCQ